MIWLKLIILISIASVFIVRGLLWFRESMTPEENYDFWEDFKDSFLTLHWKYSDYLNDGQPRRIVPIMMILGGVGILVIGIVKIQ